MIGVPFHSRVMPPSRLDAKIWGIFSSKFLYVRDFPEYTYNIAQIQAYIVCVLKSRKTYSRYLKKIPQSEIPPVFLLTQYLYVA
eukprot:SAG11_NODE_356_length_10291_cov_22.716150_1_plen_84_part_00